MCRLRRRCLFAVLVVVMAACSTDPADTADTGTPPVTAAPEETTTTTTTTTTVPADPMYRWEVGDCLLFELAADLPYEPFGPEPLASCDESHTHEVYFTGTFPGGDAAPYPEESIDAEIREVCMGAFIDSLGLLPAESSFDILMYLPDADEWADGLRYQACLAYLPAGFETYRELTGSLAEIGADFPLEVAAGACFPAVYVKLPPVDCAGTHLAEAIGVITHPADAGAPFPGEAELELFAVSECSALLGDYLAEGRGSETVAAFARAFSRLEWDAGWRDLTCLAFVVGASGEIASVAGSFAEPGWSVVTGQQQA